MTITYRAGKEVEPNSLGDLFLSVNWPLGYQPDKLRRAFSRSDQVITAWDGEKLVGLVNTIADWNAFIAAGTGAFDELVGSKAVAPIKEFPDFEHLEAQGQDQIEGFLRWIKERQLSASK